MIDYSIRECGTVEVIRVVSLAGNGTDDPLREVTSYFTSDGALIAADDPTRSKAGVPMVLSGPYVEIGCSDRGTPKEEHYVEINGVRVFAGSETTRDALVRAVRDDFVLRKL